MRKKKKKTVNARNKTLTSNVDGNDKSLRTSGLLFPSLVIMKNLRVEGEEILREAVEYHLLEE